MTLGMTLLWCVYLYSHHDYGSIDFTIHSHSYIYLPCPYIIQVDLDNDLVEVPAKDLNYQNAPFSGSLARKLERYASPATALSDSFRWWAPTPKDKGNGGPQWPPVQRGPDVRAALLVLREFVQGLLMGMEGESLLLCFAQRKDRSINILCNPCHPAHTDCCYRICNESEMTILFDEILFGHIIGPPELLVVTNSDTETDFLPHSPCLAAIPPADDPSSLESFVLRFSRTQAFSTILTKGLLPV